MNGAYRLTHEYASVVANTLEYVDGHLFVVEEFHRHYLIDTGSPVSLGYGDIVFGGQRYEPASSLAGVTMKEVRQHMAPDEHLSANVDALIGMDILSQWQLLFDVPGGQLLCTTAGLRLPDDVSSYPVRNIGGVPFVEGQLDDGEPALFAFDTGAQLSYLRAAPASEPGPIRVVKDFFPRLGGFETPVYRRRWWLLNGEFDETTATELDFGVLPPMLGLALGIAGAGGIIGAEFLRDCPVWFSPGSWLAVGPPGPSGLTP